MPIVLKSIFSATNEETPKKKRGRPPKNPIPAVTTPPPQEKKKEPKIVTLTEDYPEHPPTDGLVGGGVTLEEKRYPIFPIGQRVQQVHFENTFKGTVVFDGINTPFVRIRWDDGSIQYAAKGNLTLIAKKAYKKLFTNKKVTPDNGSDLE